MPYYISPKVYFLIESKPTDELERIYIHLLNVKLRLIVNRDLRVKHINTQLIHLISDVIHYRFIDELELTYLGSDYSEVC